MENDQVFWTDIIEESPLDERFSSNETSYFSTAEGRREKKNLYKKMRRVVNNPNKSEEEKKKAIIEYIKETFGK